MERRRRAVREGVMGDALLEQVRRIEPAERGLGRDWHRVVVVDCVHTLLRSNPRNLLPEKSGNLPDFVFPTVFGDFRDRPLEAGDPEAFAGELPAVAREAGAAEGFFREVKAEPGAPGADLRARAAHPAGEVLKMADGIPEIAMIAAGCRFQNPNQRAIWRRVGLENRVIRREVRHPGFVQLENRLRGFSNAPLRLCVGERVSIEIRALRRPMPVGERKIVY
jgi:hypothetical protein